MKQEALTKEEAEKQFLDFINNDVYKLAGKFVKENPIIGIPYHHYTQELVGEIWLKKDEYSPELGQISTWCYNKFKAKKSSLLYPYSRGEVSLDSLLENAGDGFIKYLADNKDEINEHLYYVDLLSKAGRITQSYFYGFTMRELEKKYNKSLSTIKRIIDEDIEKLKIMIQKDREREEEGRENGKFSSKI